MALLEIEELGVRFGGVTALDDASFTVDRGQICGLIGPNGAGKTTLFNCVSRLYSPDRGRIRFEGRNLEDVPAHAIASLGISRTFQNVGLIPSLTVLENVMLGAHWRGRANFATAPFRLPGVVREARSMEKQALGILDRLDLLSVADRPAQGLPFGTLKRIELARSLVAEPSLVLLDEPASGLTHSEVGHLGEVIRRIRDDFSLTVLLVEHHMNLVMSTSEKVVVLNFGRKIAEGPPEAVQQDPQVIEAYLGETA